MVTLLMLVMFLNACGSNATLLPASKGSNVEQPSSGSVTIDSLISACAEAMGGVERIAELQTMRFAQYFPDHGGTLHYEIRRPDNVRMGDQLVFNGEWGAFLTSDELIAQEEWKDFYIDIAWYIPAFYDYPAVYAGMEEVDGVDSHKIEVNLPGGSVMTYFLDAHTYLISRISAGFTLYDQLHHAERTCSDYREVDGILYPHACTYLGRNGTDLYTATMESIEFDVPLEDERFEKNIEDDSIAFASDADGDFDIWSMNSDGSGQQNLTNDDGSDISPAWSPEGDRIAFVSDRSGSEEIWIMNADGSDPRQLTDTPDAGESFPSWSPDGNQITFDSDRGGNWDIYVMASDGSNVIRLTDNPDEDWISSWSPDGRQILFESHRDGNYEIYVMNTDGSNQQRLTSNSIHDGAGKWSPDGSRITFFSRRDGNYEVYSMDADGGNATRLTDNPAEDTFPCWSANGKWIVFVSDRSGNDEIWIMNADGSGLQRLTDSGSHNWNPAWRPEP